MNQRKHLTLVAAGASLLGALPLATVFAQWNWLIDAFLIIAAMCGTALLVRSLRAPTWAPTVAMVGVGLIVLTWLFPSKAEILGIIPSTNTFAHFNELLTTATTEMSEFAAPVEARPGFLFLTTLGVGGVAIVVDLFAVVLRRPALAGLPMLAIYSVPVAVADESVNFIPFVLGAGGFLWLLVTDNVDRVRRFGRRFTGDGRDVDLWEPSPLAAAGQRLALVGLAFAVLLPMAYPGTTTGLLERFGSGTGPGIIGGGGSGRSVSFSALLSGQLNQDRATEMIKVTNVNDPNPFYLRFAVADDLRSDGFFNRQLPTGSPINNGIPGPNYVSEVNAKSYKATIQILNLEIPFLPLYTYTTKAERFDNSWVFDRTTQTIYSGKQTTRKRSYSLDYLRADFTPEQLRSAPALRSNDQAAQFAAAPKVDKVDAKVQQLIAGKNNQYDKVRAIFDFFSTSNGFQYDRTTGAETSGSKIVDFLENKRGFCVQYAAAMAWLLRDAKIPARVAFGFTRGGAKQGNTMTLTNFNLHAWTEVYFQGFGWVPFDATPATAIGGSVSPNWAPNPSEPESGGPNDDSDVPRPGQSVDPNASAGPVGPETNQGGGDSTTGSDGGFLSTSKAVAPYAGGGLLLLLLVASPALARLRTRRRRLNFVPMPAFVAAGPPGSAPPGADGATGMPVVLPPDDAAYVAARGNAHRAWDELLDSMIDYGIPIDDSETPRTTGVRLIARERLHDKAETSVRLLSTAEEHARYARRPITGGELRTSLSAVRSAFAARASRGTRFRATFLPSSVLQRWGRGTSRRFTDVVNAVGRWRDQVVRTLSVRRRLVARRAGR